MKSLLSMPGVTINAWYISADSDPCLQDFNLFTQEMAKVHGDRDWRCVTRITQMQEFLWHTSESVRVYANHVKANFRQVGGNLLKHEEVLYDIAWAGLYKYVMTTVGLIMPTSSAIDCLEEFIEQAATSELTHVENKKPLQQQQHQQQRQQKQPRD